MTEEKLTQTAESQLPEEPQEARSAEPAQGMEEGPDDSEWYVVHTYSGYENKVCENLNKRILTQNMRDQIFQVLVPVEEEISFATDSNSGKQKRRTVKRKIYPGYVLINMKMNDRSWYVVRNTPGVTGFVSPGLKPVPLPREEVEKIKQLMGLSAPQKVKIELEVGQTVRVTSGALQDHCGTVVEVNPESEKVRILVTMFGRETPATVEFGQVEKI